MNKKDENKNAEISARIRQVIEYLNETPNSFAKKLGYDRAQTVYDILNMKSAPSFDFFRRFSNAEYSDIVNLDWLLTGNGKMKENDSSNISIGDYNKMLYAKGSNNTMNVSEGESHSPRKGIIDKLNKENTELKIGYTLLKNELQLKEKELQLKEKELQLKEKELTLNKDKIDTLTQSLDEKERMINEKERTINILLSK